MNRIGCSSHMLDKIGAKDSVKANSDTSYKNMYDKVFGKLHVIWDTKSKRLCAEEFTRITKKKLIGPHRIRWMKTFGAVTHILNIEQE